jgi:hypothetical protein
VNIHKGKMGVNSSSMAILSKINFPSAITSRVLYAGNIYSTNLEIQSSIINLRDRIYLMKTKVVYVYVRTEANPTGEIFATI